VVSANPQIQIVDNEHEAIKVLAAKEPEKRIFYLLPKCGKIHEKGIKCIPSYKHKEA
jgi:hypothetical protein